MRLELWSEVHCTAHNKVCTLDYRLPSKFTYIRRASPWAARHLRRPVRALYARRLGTCNGRQ